MKESKSGDGISLLQSLLSNINSKSTPRRALFSLPFEIGPGLKIGVKGYILLKRQTIVKTCYVWVGGQKVQIAVGSTQQLAEDTARTVEKTEIRKAYTFGGEKIPFTEEEIKKIRNFGDPTLRIIGFKNIDLLPVWASYRSAHFIYPSETDFVGSTRVFSALQQTMLLKKKFALTWFIARRNAVPVLAAAVPGAEKLNDDGTQQMPPGLWLISLPFADDLRQNPETEQQHAPDSLIDAMRVVIQQLQLPKAVYDPKKYPNPSLQWFYRVLQSMALEEDVPEEPEDKTIPRYRQIAKVSVAQTSSEPGLSFCGTVVPWQLGDPAPIPLTSGNHILHVPHSTPQPLLLVSTLHITDKIHSASATTSSPGAKSSKDPAAPSKKSYERRILTSAKPAATRRRSQNAPRRARARPLPRLVQRQTTQR